MSVTVEVLGSMMLVVGFGWLGGDIDGDNVGEVIVEEVKASDDVDVYVVVDESATSGVDVEFKGDVVSLYDPTARQANLKGILFAVTCPRKRSAIGSSIFILAHANLATLPTYGWRVKSC